MAAGTRNEEAWSQHQRDLDKEGVGDGELEESVFEPRERLESEVYSAKLVSGDIAVLTEDVECSFGTVLVGTSVELLSTFPVDGKMQWKVKTLGCRACTLVVTFNAPKDVLEDYEVSNPSVQFS